MIINYTQEEYNQAKSNTLLDLKCTVCDSPFKKQKKYIKLALKGNPNCKCLTCSKVCANYLSIINRGDKPAVQVQCTQCTKPFFRQVHRLKSNNNAFCSKSCSTTYTNKTHPKRKKQRPPKKCAVCDNFTLDHNRKYCPEHKYYKRQQLLKKTLQDIINRPRRRKHQQNTYDSIRNLAKNMYKHLKKLPCAVCGYNKHVELCHIKSISSFPLTAKISEINHSSNIIQLCPNCHWELDHDGLSL